MNFLVSVSSCNDAGLARVMLGIKNGLNLIQIIVPILLMVMASINIAKVVRNPDDKKLIPKIKNSFMAAAVVFFVPLFLNVLMQILGTNTLISDCWNNASVGSANPGYSNPGDNSKKSKIYTDPGDYQ